MVDCNEDLVNKMASEVALEELEVMNDIESNIPINLADFQGTTADERIDKALAQMTFRQEEITLVVRNLADKFDISHPKTYSQIRAIVRLMLVEKELYKEVRAQLIVKNKSKGNGNISTNTALDEHRKYNELIGKLIKEVYVPDVRKDVAFTIPREQIYGTSKYILIEEPSKLS